jgi:hypothetical protein
MESIMKQLFLILCASIAMQLSVSACSCLFIPTFCETITRPGYVDSNYLIIHGRVESKNQESMQVRILDVLFGTPEDMVVTIPQGYGADCRESINGFEPNGHSLFALYGDTYHLSICGVTWLPIVGDVITGAIAPGISHLKIKDFPTLNNCGDIGAVLTFISVYPTLTSEHIKISSSRDIENIDISVHDMMGRRVFTSTSEALLEAEPLVISADHLAAGCYAITIRYAGIRKTYKVVVVS